MRREQPLISKCVHCIYYNFIDKIPGHGYCRHDSPSTTEVEDGGPNYTNRFVAVWPIVNGENDWCGEGEHK